MYNNRVLQMCNNQIEDKIDNLRKDTVNRANKIALGSDEHLDILIPLIDEVKMFSDAMESIIEISYEKLNSISDEIIKDKILPSFEKLYAACMSYIYAVEQSPYAKHFKDVLNTYKDNHDNIKEIIHDLNIRIKSDDEITALMNEIDNLPI